MLFAYKIIHILGALMLFSSLGALAHHAINGGTKANDSGRGLALALHGTGLLLLLVAGFGMLARGGFMTAGLPHGWIAGKLAIWLLLGAAVAFVGKSKALGRIVWLGALLLGAAAAWLAIAKPF